MSQNRNRVDVTHTMTIPSAWSFCPERTAWCAFLQSKDVAFADDICDSVINYLICAAMCKVIISVRRRWEMFVGSTCHFAPVYSLRSHITTSYLEIQLKVLYYRTHILNLTIA